MSEPKIDGVVSVSGAISGSSGWTLETLKVYFEAVLSERDRAVLAAFAAQKSAVDAALAAADRAVAKAEDAAERRFESVNEFRAQLKDQQIGLITRAEADVEFRAMRDKIDLLTNRMDRTEGRGSGADKTVQYVLAGLSAILTLLLIGGIVVGIAYAIRT